MSFPIFLLVLASCACLVALEMGRRAFRIPIYVTRRLAHMGTALVAAIAPFFASRDEIMLISVLFAVAMLVARRYRLFQAIHEIERASYGELYLPLGVVLTALFFLPAHVAAFQFGILSMGISDALAGLVGERSGRHHLTVLGGVKSIQGSLAFLVSNFLIAIFFFPMAGYGLFVAPLMLTILEFFLAYGLDNLFIPVAGALLLQYFL